MTTDTDAKPQTIFRAEHGKENPYFMHRRKTAQDKQLSFAARGLLGYLLSKPDDWEISESDLRKEGGVGRDKIKKLIAELVKQGYMTKEQPHDSDKGRFLQNVYITHETPLTEKPSTGLPSTVNPQEHNTDSLENTEETITDAEKAPDADGFPEGTIGLDEMMAELDITQADLDAPPLDEIVPSAIPVANAVEIDPVGEYVADMAAPAYDPPKPKPKRKRSAKQLALDAMKNALADAFGLAHDKVTSTKWNEFGKAGKELLEVGATVDDMHILHGWCTGKGWENFSSIAMAKEYAAFDKVRQQMYDTTPQSSTTTAHETRTRLGLVDA